MRAATSTRNEWLRCQVDRLRREADLLGLSAVVAPPLVLVSFGFIGFLIGAPGRMLTAAFEVGLPLGLGLTSASVLAGEPSLELQLSAPGGFRPAMLRRLGLVFGWALAVSLAGYLIARLAGLLDSWLPRLNPVESLLLPAAPLAAFGAWGCLLGVAMRSRGSAAAALAGFWLVALWMKDWLLGEAATRAWFPFMYSFRPDAPDALENRIGLLIVAAGGLLLAALILGRDEWLLGSEDS